MTEEEKARRRANLRKWRANNPERVKKHNRRQAATHTASIREYKRRWAAGHPRQLSDGDRENAAARARRWNKAHPEVVNALTAKRKAAKKRRTPTWLTKAHLAEIEGVYHFARLMKQMTGRAHHVDHIVPLQGRTVSGLHVPNNLRVISAHENQIKSNRWV